MNPKWLEWSQRLQSISQAGLTYSTNPYDIERYEMLKELYKEIVSDHTLNDLKKIENLFANENGYLTPKMDVRGVVFRDDKILLVKEKIDGKWSIPGGWADIGLSPSEVAVKEIQEESGFDTKALRMMGVFDKKYFSHPVSPYYSYKIFILCEIIGGGPTAGLETSEVGFFELDNLPQLSVGRVTEEQIVMMFKMYRENIREAYFN